MPAKINLVKIGGYITEPRQRGNGPVRFSINTGGGKKRDETNWPDCWHRITAWTNRVPEAAQLKKGQYVTVTGRIEYPARREGQSIEDFIKWGEFCQITASGISTEVETPPARSNAVTPERPITDEDIPFN